MIALTPAEIRLRSRTAVAIGDDHFRDEAGGFRLGLDRADHFLAPAIADQRVGDADDEFIGGRGAGGERGQRNRAEQ
jgi:hypothetical protein